MPVIHWTTILFTTIKERFTLVSGDPQVKVETATNTVTDTTKTLESIPTKEISASIRSKAGELSTTRMEISIKDHGQTVKNKERGF